MARDEGRQGRLDWAAATVEDGELTVGLLGDPDKAWAKDLERIAGQLQRSGSTWGAVEVTRKKVTVASVRAGAEEDVHHLLEAAVLQVNADHAPAEAEAEADDGAEGAPEDREMAERFRGFADAEDRPEGDGP